MAKRALICGISGQDGSCLARFLLGKGYEVFGSSRDIRGAQFGNLDRMAIRREVRLLSMDVNNLGDVLRVFSEVRPDEVYNLAGQSSVGLSFERPVETLESISRGTMNLLEAIRTLDGSIRFFNAGSTECFGDTGWDAVDEGACFHPKSPYGVAKAAAFWEVVNYRESYDLFACTGILSPHESPFRNERFVTRRIVCGACRIAAGKSRTLDLGNISIARDWGWAPEYVDAMWRLLQQDSPDDFIIATGESNRLEDFAAQAFACVGLDWREHVVSDPKRIRPLEIMVSSCAPAKAEKLLGWKARYRMRDVVQMMVAAELDLLKDAEKDHVRSYML